MAMKVKLVFTRATANNYRYEKDPEDPAPVIVSLYIEKGAVDGAKPRKHYTINIEEA